MKIFLIDLFYHFCNLEFGIWNLILSVKKKTPTNRG